MENKNLENVVSHIYDKTNDEMMAIAKSIKSGASVSPIVKEAFEKVLEIRYTERYEVYNFYYDICKKSIPCCGCSKMDYCTSRKVG